MMDNTAYDELFAYVQAYFAEHGAAVKAADYPFRDRADHSWRVYIWAKRLLDEGTFDVEVDGDAILTAAVFHDIGYVQTPDGSKEHSRYSAEIFNDYVKVHPIKRAEFIEYLIRNHNNADAFHDPAAPIELILLVEADLLDETGALSIVWDCLAEGVQVPDTDYNKTYEHIVKFTGRSLRKNPMKTVKAQEYWVEKQLLVSKFLRHLAFDLVMEE